MFFFFIFVDFRIIGIKRELLVILVKVGNFIYRVV